jgi:hypothetical protein
MESQIREALQNTEISDDGNGKIIMSFKTEFWHSINQKTSANIVSCNLCDKTFWDCDCFGEDAVKVNKNLISWDMKRGKEGRCYCRQNPHGCNPPSQDRRGCQQLSLRTWTGQPLLKYDVCSIGFPPRSHDDIVFIFKQRIEKVYMSGWLSLRSPYIDSLEKQVRDLQCEVFTINENQKTCMKEISLLRKEFNKNLTAKAYENIMLEKDVMALKSEVETLKKALADTLAALATK